MERFESYLRDQGLRPATARRYRQRLRSFTAFLGQEGLTAAEVDYRDVLLYLAERREQVEPSTLRHDLVAVRYFMASLVAQGHRPSNPAAQVKLQGETSRLPHDLLTEEQLDQIYEQAPTGTPSQQRNRVIVGLLVYQGLTTGEIERLHLQDVELDKGRLHVHPSAKSAGRVLPLDGGQVLAFYRYVQETRPALLAERGQAVEARLFVSTRGGRALKNTLTELVQGLRRRHGFVKSARQLRASRIVLWLRHENLRQVQYWAGHHSVQSTQRYREADVEALLDALRQVHRLDGY